jgi:pyrophosphatase PpaX
LISRICERYEEAALSAQKRVPALFCYAWKMNLRRAQDRGIRGVLFDWDGTLLNSFEADTAAYLAMFRAMGIPWGNKELGAHYSPNWYRVYRAAKLPRSKWPEADRLWREHYSQHRPKMIRGARSVLRKLVQRHALGLVTSGDRNRVLRQLREFQLSEVFAARVCSGDTRLRKPHPAPLRLALRRMGLEATQCVYVGDSPEDLQMARRAGVRAAIAVLGPFPTEKGLRAERPDLLLESIGELPEALLGISTQG